MAGPNGGRREGAGRPKGSKSALPLGDVKALKSLRRRIPDEVSEEDAETAEDAFKVMVDVMTGKIHEKNGGRLRLSAATAVREDVCIPKKQQVEHSVDSSLSALIAGTHEDADGGNDDRMAPAAGSDAEDGG